MDCHSSEIALKLLEGYNPDEELELSRIKSHTFDRIKQVNKEGKTPLHVIAGIPSATAFRLLQKYMTFRQNILSYISGFNSYFKKSP